MQLPHTDTFIRLWASYAASGLDEALAHSTFRKQFLTPIQSGGVISHPQHARPQKRAGAQAEELAGLWASYAASGPGEALTRLRVMLVGKIPPSGVSRLLGIVRADVCALLLAAKAADKAGAAAAPATPGAGPSQQQKQQQGRQQQRQSHHRGSYGGGAAGGAGGGRGAGGAAKPQLQVGVCVCACV